MSADNAPLLQIESLRKWFPIRRGVLATTVGHVKAVDDVSFTVRSHEVLGLAGESGSGKTTIGRCVLRLVEPSGGRILFDGIDVTALTPRALRHFRRKAQMVFQDPLAALNPQMTVAEIISEPLQVQSLCANREQRRERIVELLANVALAPDFMARRPNEMSGGQRQRVVIARALAVAPQFLVADEPVSALDVSIQAQIVNLLTELKQRLGLAMLFISHDVAVMEHIADRIAVLYLGRIMEIGPSRTLCAAPKHPYTEALISAVPDPEPASRRKRILLKGDIPKPSAPPTGCVFRTRCPYAIAACASVIPPLRQVGPERYSACIRDDVL